MGMLISIFVLSTIIFFHELGHYTAARLVGVHIEVFSIGFGKKIASFQRWGTQWRIALIPLGGFVQMKGQNDYDPISKNTDDDSYTTKTPLQRIFILLAGPFANFVLAFILYFFIGLGSPNVLSPVIGKVSENSPAFIAGIQSNDTIRSINGVEITSWKEMAKIISSSEGSLKLKILRDGFFKYTVLTPQITQTKIYKEVIERKMIGITSAGVTHHVEMNFDQTLTYATQQTIFASSMIFTGVKKLFMGDIPAKELGGVIGIVKLSIDATDSGWISVLFFAALISVNLGILNLLPIPALDGGHIMFNLYEMITRRTPNEKVLINFTIAGWIILVSLMGLGLFNDIARLLG